MNGHIPGGTPDPMTRALSHRDGGRTVAGARRRILILVLLLAAAASGAAAREAAPDAVVVPGGPAAYRRLFELDSARDGSRFLLDLHERLLFNAPEDVSWSQIEARRKAVAFAEDLAEWRRLFGEPARFSAAAGGEAERCRRAIEFLGFSVVGNGVAIETERRGDAAAMRRQRFLDALGTPTASFLGRLRDGETVTVSAPDATVPLPYGLDAWRRTLASRDLSKDTAFVAFLRDVRASRMLVALDALDPETRDGLRDAGDPPLGWRTLYVEALEGVARFPEALRARDGRFELPGGAEAEPLWKATVGAPAAGASFWRGFYTQNQGKAAYVADSLWHLRDEQLRPLLFGPRPRPDAVEQFRGLYQAVGDRSWIPRDPYDFAHLAPFLAARPAGAIAPPGAADPKFPRDETELAALLAGRPATPVPDDAALRRLLQRGPAGPGDTSVPRRFLFFSSLLARRPDLADPGLALLIALGFPRFSPALAVLHTFPFPGPELARRYVFALDRLDRPDGGRDAEVATGLFQGYVILLDRFADAGTLGPPVAADLLSSLLRVPPFAGSDVSPAQGEADLFEWTSKKLLPALRQSLAAGDDADPDELLDAAMSARSAPAPVPWRGGRFLFDVAADETARRHAFRQTQSLAGFSDLETLHRQRRALFSAASSGSLEAARNASADLALTLRVDARDASLPDDRLRKAEDRARAAAEGIASPSSRLAEIPARAADFDGLIAERHLEAVLGHVYAASARDPNDLYFQDPLFVARHSFRTVERATASTRTVLTKAVRGGGYQISGSLFGLPEILGLLHADQLSYTSGTSTPMEEFRSAFVAPVWQMSSSRLDDDALELVADCSEVTRELARALDAASLRQRLDAWDGLARDILPRARIARIASREGGEDEPLSDELSPSDLYRVGRRLARESPASIPPLPAALRAREDLARLTARRGEAGAARCLEQFGPSAEVSAGAPALSDRDLPPYERLAAYRRPELLAERLYDLKVAVAVRVAEANLPAAVLPLVLPAALDRMLSGLRMAYAFDWRAATRAAAGFSAADLERILDDAVESGRLVRDLETPSERAGGGA
jgi:hypothetical protein